MQGCTMADLDGDGILDLFACHDDGLSRLWKGGQNAEPTPDNTLIPLDTYDFSGYPFTDHSGNYGVVTADVNGDGHTDVYIAKCRQFVVDPEDPRRVNQLWMSDGNGGWTEEAAARGLVVNEQSWTADFGDIDNDGDLDALITNHSNVMNLLENDGTGHFTDITSGSGLGVSGFFLQAKFADLDNDGYLDLLTSGGNGAGKLFMGAGDGTFDAVAWPFSHPDPMLGFALGDVGRDGTLDVYATYGDVYVSPDPYNPDLLYLNGGNAHHWIGFDLQGVIHNLDAVGASVALHGAWGVQMREVRAGESYGMTCTHHVLFGLGPEISVDSAVIRFPGGLEQVLMLPEIDTYHELFEAPCTLPAFDLSLSGDSALCPGAALEVSTGQPGLQHQWNTGATGHAITVTNPGVYRVLVTDQQGCAGMSHPLTVVSATPVAPVVVVDGVLEGCADRTVVVQAIAEGDWSWSDGSTAPSRTITSDGTFFVSLLDGCGHVQSSDTLTIIFHPNPTLPIVSDTIVAMPSVVGLEAGGVLANWFGAEDQIDPWHVGPTFETPMLDSTSTFWVEALQIYNEEVAQGGRTEQGNGAYLGNENYWLLFDAHEDVVLDSVLVFANGEGERTLALVDAGGTALDQVTATLPDGPSYVALGFAVEEGSGYGLRCLSPSPQLWRDGVAAELDFPYAVGDLLTITENNLQNASNNTGYYYYFYDWHVSRQTTACTSPRVPLTITARREGCTYVSASNFDPIATHEDGNCHWVGCMDDAAINYHPIHTIADDSCIYTMNPPDSCPADLNADGLTGSADLLMFLTDFGEVCSE